MNKKRLLLTVWLALVFTITILAVDQSTVDSQECRIIRIHPERKTLRTTVRIEPRTLSISKGACVVWVNFVSAQQVRVIFREDGKKCQDATGAPMGFTMAENCYVTNLIPLGGTTSLRFNEEGAFNYEVEVPVGDSTDIRQRLMFKVEGKGEILVHP